MVVKNTAQQIQWRYWPEVKWLNSMEVLGGSEVAEFIGGTGQIQWRYWVEVKWLNPQSFKAAGLLQTNHFVHRVI